MLDNKHSRNGDVYSFGVVLFSTLTGRHPMQHPEEKDTQMLPNRNEFVKNRTKQYREGEFKLN